MIAGRRAAVVAGWAVVLGAAATAGTRAILEGGRRPVTHTVTIDATRYQPAALAVRVGDTVVWVNRDVIPHTATSAGWDSTGLATDESWRLTVKAAGTLDYTCRYHPAMRGRLTVSAP